MRAGRGQTPVQVRRQACHADVLAEQVQVLLGVLHTAITGLPDRVVQVDWGTGPVTQAVVDLADAAAGGLGDAAGLARVDEQLQRLQIAITVAEQLGARVAAATVAGPVDAFQRDQGLGKGSGMEAAWVVEERDDGGWWLPVCPARGDRVRIPDGRVGAVEEPQCGKVYVSAGDDPRNPRWGTLVRYPYRPPRRRLPAIDAPQAYAIGDHDLAEMGQYAADAVLRRGLWVQMRPGDAEYFPDGICAVCEGEDLLHCLTCGGDATLTCPTCGGTNRCQVCSEDEDCDHGCGNCRGAHPSCPDCRDGKRPCPQRCAKWCHLDG